jgi:1,2-diacylglycerol 3-beta-glucosyltransferase
MFVVMAIVVVMLALATGAMGYYFLLTFLGWSRRRTAAVARSRSVAVLVPAHNEALGIPRTLASLIKETRPTDRIVVLADNCTDATATVAWQAGVECLERHEPAARGKGYGLAWAIPQLPPTDIVMILDADCALEPGFFHELEAAFAAGADVVQAKVSLSYGGSAAVRVVSEVGAEIENAVSAGLERLNGTITLRGSGMAFRREVLEAIPWSSFGITEDAEFSARLQAAGIRVQFAPEAVVHSEVAPNLSAMTRQRQRWRASLFTGTLNLGHRWLRSKPVVLMQLGLTVLLTAMLTLWLPTTWPLFAWSGLLALLSALVYLRAIRRSTCSPRDLLATPWLVFRLAVITLGGLVALARPWERTTRNAEVG